MRAVEPPLLAALMQPLYRGLLRQEFTPQEDRDDRGTRTSEDRKRGCGAGAHDEPWHLGIDERRINAKAADAAARLLADNYATFKDWGLAIAAYNMGREVVKQATLKGATRDPWALARKGHINRYLSAVVAAIIISRNPPQD